MTLSRGQGADVHGSGPDASAREGLAMSIMSHNDIEGDPVQFLRVSEAYWQASCYGMIAFHVNKLIAYSLKYWPSTVSI